MRSFLCSLLLVPAGLYGQHTFSIVAVDEATGEVGSAGASCIANSWIISDVHPGVGAIHTQSYYNSINQSNASFRMDQGDSAQQIVDFIVANDVANDPGIRQYGVARFDTATGSPDAAAFTGVNCLNYKNHIDGPYYAIQGNILLGQQILDSMEARFLNTTGSLADRLMAAMQGANVPGADTRCLNDGVSSLSSFIKVAQANDQVGNLYLDIVLSTVPNGVEPIDTLQTRFDAWKNALGVEAPWDELQVSVFPNPALDMVSFQMEQPGAITIEFYSPTGRFITAREWDANVLSVDTGSMPSGLIYYRLIDGTRIVRIGSFVVL